MEYLEKDDAALREMWRVLKPGGRAVITGVCGDMGRQ
jgi:ubiquinone/menaquinone biosynthesis C-methylase UbiE